MSPRAIDFSPAPGSIVVGLRPQFTISFDEPIDPGTWLDFGLIVQAANGTLVSGDFTYEVSDNTGMFVPSSALTPGLSYIVTIGAVADIGKPRRLAGVMDDHSDGAIGPDGRR